MSILRVLLGPPRCQLCTQPLSETEQHVCLPCLDQFIHLSRCQHCGLPCDGSPTHCGQCLAHTPLWHRLYSVAPYQFPIDSLVHRFKYRREPHLAERFADWLVPHINDPAPLLLPVPMHWRRRWQRGYNQSFLLARALAKRTHSVTNSRILTRIRHTPAQQSLSRHARLINLRDAFHIQPSIELPDHVALVDDVVTTGATLNSLITLLKEAGVSRIDVYCICRADIPR